MVTQIKHAAWLMILRALFLSLSSSYMYISIHTPTIDIPSNLNTIQKSKILLLTILPTARKMSRTKSKRDLPGELWQEILSRFSIELIVQLRCVSKSWRSMIDDPDFCRLHLRRFSDNRQQTHLLVITKDVQLKGHRLHFGPNPFKLINILNLLTDSVLHQSYFTLPTPHDRINWNPLSSIDGLVMLVRDERGVLYPSPTPKLLLWNPSIRKSRVLPPSPKLPLSTRYVDVGLGFDPLINDYKHVRIAHLDDGIPKFVAIYTVGLGSWKSVLFQSKSCLNCCWVYFSSSTSCRSRGHLFSIAFSPDSKEGELVTFDFGNEVFTSTSLPKFDVGFSRGFPIKKHLMVVNDKCLLVQQTAWGGFVWTLESSETDSGPMYWTKRYSINMMDWTFKLLPSTQEPLGTEEILQNKLEERVIRIIIDFPFPMVRLFDYFESLVLLK